MLPGEFCKVSLAFGFCCVGRRHLHTGQLQSYLGLGLWDSTGSDMRPCSVGGRGCSSSFGQRVMYLLDRVN